jgi:hypothetical protein
VNALPRYAEFKMTTPVVAATSSKGYYRPSEEDYVGTFYKLLRKLARETAISSNPMVYVRHPAFAEIISLGDKVVPLIIASLQVKPSHIMLALPTLTGENVVTPDVQGRPAQIAAKWVEWYNRRVEL